MASTPNDGAPVDPPVGAARPPSVDSLARTLAGSGLPHPLCVDLARQAIAAGSFAEEDVMDRAERLRAGLLGPVINATGVLLHSNLGRAPLGGQHPNRAINLELDMDTGERGSRQAAVGGLLARLCGAEAAMVVNNNAAAVLLVLAALANGREVLVSRGESVEIGGGFRVPEVMEQSGARLVDVGTTNRTRLADYQRALVRPGGDVAMALKVHPSNYRVEGFVEATSIEQLATLDVPVVADIGSGLIDATCPWMPGAPPVWLADEPAVRQTLAAGAALVTFSGDKLFGGPQAGVIAGRAELVERCQRHPLARALRPGGHTMMAMQRTTLAYLQRTAVTDVAFWQMVSESMVRLRIRAMSFADAFADLLQIEVLETDAVPGAGSAPGTTIPSVGLRIAGDHLAALRRHSPPVIGRARDGATYLDLRSVHPDDDVLLADALRACV